MSETQATFLSWIDGPAEGLLESRFLTMTGWCFTPTVGAAQAVRARIGNRLFKARIHLPRPDVFAILKDPAGSHSGFELALELPEGASECHVEATRDGLEWTLLKALHFQCPSYNGLRRLWNGLSKRWKIRSGNPEAWSTLPANERRYHLTRAEQDGLPSIVHFQQHAPQALRTETFPPRPANAPAPRFCIVTPSFGQGEFIGATVDSVLSQQGVEIDYHVQDGASKDNTVAVLQAKAGKPLPASLRYSWISEPDSGQSDAIARGFKYLKSRPDDLMGYLNSDDLLLPGTLGFVADYFAAHPEVDALYGHRININSEGLEIGRWVSPRRSCDNLLLHDLIPQETLFWRRGIWERIKGIDTSFRFAMDWDLLLRMERAGARIDRVPWFLGAFRVHERQKTQSWIGEVGMQEMAQLRRRELGREPSQEEISSSLDCARLDSLHCALLLRQGIRR